jgi:murein DD-endopeptidase MepM/ murein hydrolase activator NlpD
MAAPQRSLSVGKALLLGTVLAAGLTLGIGKMVERSKPILEVTPTPAFRQALLDRPAPGEAPLDLDALVPPEPFEIRRGQTLGGLLHDLGLEPAEARAAVGALGEHVEVRRIRAGEEGFARYDAEGRLTAFELRLAGKGRVALARAGDGWRSSWREVVRVETLSRVEGELKDSLISAIQDAGGPAELAYAMSRVLQWDLDFNRDLRRGDRFQVLFEEVTLDGRYAGVGNVLAVAYENRGRKLEAYRYNDGYYDGVGRPSQKMFLRSPLPFTRVTSRFSRSRFHPVLKKYRPHYGVDYGAPRGTPVRATAHGVVDFVGRNGGAGNMVRLRHANRYETSYLHLSGYAKGLRRGQRVSQGDLIGYVGSTGLSTGPHLDYRVKKNGSWIDPLSLRNTPAQPISQQDLPQYLARRDALRDAMNGADLPPEAPPADIATTLAKTAEGPVAAPAR